MSDPVCNICCSNYSKVTEFSCDQALHKFLTPSSRLNVVRSSSSLLTNLNFQDVKCHAFEFLIVRSLYF